MSWIASYTGESIRAEMTFGSMTSAICRGKIGHGSGGWHPKPRKHEIDPLIRRPRSGRDDVLMPRQALQPQHTRSPSRWNPCPDSGGRLQLSAFRDFLRGRARKWEESRVPLWTISYERFGKFLPVSFALSPCSRKNYTPRPLRRTIPVLSGWPGVIGGGFSACRPSRAYRVPAAASRLARAASRSPVARRPAPSPWSRSSSRSFSSSSFSPLAWKRCSSRSALSFRICSGAELLQRCRSCRR